jgi:hypothetical protein
MTMELIYRNATPTYQGSQTRPQPGLLSGLGSLFGCGATPTYKTVDGESAQAPKSCRSWWQVFAVTPSYKTAAPSEDEVERDAADPGNGDVAAEPACGRADQATQVVIL